MTEYTPKTLRDGKNVMRDWIEMCDWLDAHADAWEITEHQLRDAYTAMESHKATLLATGARIEALEELVSAERDLPLKIEPDYDDPHYTEKHQRAADARKAAGMPLPPHDAALAQEKE